MLLYYALILIGTVLVIMAVYNLFSILKIEKNMDNYLFLITSSKAYFLGTTFFALALLAIIAYQAHGYVFDIRVFSIVFFFGSLFLLALSHYIYYISLEKKLKDYKEFFKKFNIDLNNKCQKLMLKHIYEKKKNLDKVKEIFKKNKHLCEEN